MLRTVLVGAPSTLLVLCLATTAKADRTGQLARGKVFLRLANAKGGRVSRGYIEGVVDAPPDRLFAAITDYDRYEDFMPRTVASRVLSRGRRSLRYRCKLDMPWPVPDVSYEADVSWGPDRRSVRFRMVPGRGDGVRAFDGHWRLRAFDGEARRTLVQYDVLFEPETRWPRWVMDVGIKTALGAVVPSLRNRIPPPATNRRPR